ncbi:MAG: hypothetical protein ACFFCS_02125 [Candidatus Hodarchaeota archaeon]
MSLEELRMEERANKKNLSGGIIWTGILFVMVGFFMIVISRVYVTLPLNTTTIFEAMGNVDHAIGIQYYCSLAFFILGGLTIAVGVLYPKLHDNKGVKITSTIVAILHQPWIYIVAMVLAGLWAYMSIEPESDFAAFFADLMGYDIDIDKEAYEFRVVMGTYPAIEFLLFGGFGVMLYPFTMYTSSMLLHDMGYVMKKKRKLLPMRYEQKFRQYACKGLATGGVLYMIIAAIFVGLGIAMGSGIHVTYPLFKIENMMLFVWVYPWFPGIFGLLCIITALLYYYKPDNSLFRSLAWFTGIVQMIIPIIGWLFGINLMYNLWHTRERVEAKKNRTHIFAGLACALFVITLPLFTLWMYELEKLSPGNFTLVIDWNNLTAQVNGLTWIATFVLFLVLVVCSIYMFMESRASKIEAQKTLHKGLALMLLFIGLAEAAVLFYSMFKRILPIYGLDITAYIPDVGTRGDNAWAFALACASQIYFTYGIEKYIRNSKKFVLTKLILIFNLFAIPGTVISYIPAITSQDWYETGGLIFMGIPGIGMILGILSVAIIYGKLANTTSGELKKNALTILWGFIVTLAGAVLHLLRDMIQDAIGDFPFSWMIFIVVNIIGVFILLGGFLRSTY